MKNYVMGKLIGLAILVMVALVLISVIEVAIYSYLIDPGKETTVYEAHAESSAPFISGIFGFILFFLITRYWTKKGFDNVATLAFLFPLTYVLIDGVILSVAGGFQWSDFIVIFLLANGAKFLGSYLGYRLTR